MPFNQLRAIASFAKAIELGSIRKAAQAQGITPQAASQAIAQLERHLGVRLMHRTTRNLAVTEEGRHLLEQALPALGDIGRRARTGHRGPSRDCRPASHLRA